MPQLWPDALQARDRRVCARLIRSGSKSFFAASLLLPADVRADALALYAFCRLADDAVDQGTQANRVSRLRERLAAIYSARVPDTPVDRAFAAVVARHHIPCALPAALLEGFEWDLQGRQYHSAAELIDYAVRVAGSVGTMMACLMQTRTPVALARACDLGVAMQLTNIARDVGEDARNGRLYLPVEWLREAGVDAHEWLQRPLFNAAVGEVVARLLATAEEYYERAETGIAMLPRRCRWSIRAAALLYAEIGRQLQRSQGDCVAQRTVVPLSRKLVLLARSMRGRAPWTALQPQSQSQDCGPGTFLVDAVLQATPADSAPGQGRGWDPAVARLIGIFEALERRDREGAAARATTLSVASDAS